MFNVFLLTYKCKPGKVPFLLTLEIDQKGKSKMTFGCRTLIRTQINSLKT